MTESNYNPTDRRPIKSRNTRWAESTTLVLVKLGVSPNTISIAGMLAALTAGVSLFFTDSASGFAQRGLWLVAGALCQVRLLCNLFDGMVAVKSGKASPQGELFNEVPDRVSDAAVMIGLGYSAGGDLVLGYLAALVSIFVAYVRAAAKSMGAPNDFCGPMAKPQRMALVTCIAGYMTVSPEAWRLPWGETKIILVTIVAGGVLTALRRLRRASNHLAGSMK